MSKVSDNVKCQLCKHIAVRGMARSLQDTYKSFAFAGQTKALYDSTFLPHVKILQSLVRSNDTSVVLSEHWCATVPLVLLVGNTQGAKTQTFWPGPIVFVNYWMCAMGS